MKAQHKRTKGVSTTPVRPVPAAQSPGGKSPYPQRRITALSDARNSGGVKVALPVRSGPAPSFKTKAAKPQAAAPKVEEHRDDSDSKSSSDISSFLSPKALPKGKKPASTAETTPARPALPLVANTPSTIPLPPAPVAPLPPNAPVPWGMDPYQYGYHQMSSMMNGPMTPQGTPNVPHMPNMGYGGFGGYPGYPPYMPQQWPGGSLYSDAYGNMGYPSPIMPPTTWASTAAAPAPLRKEDEPEVTKEEKN